MLNDDGPLMDKYGHLDGHVMQHDGQMVTTDGLWNDSYGKLIKIMTFG